MPQTAVQQAVLLVGGQGTRLRPLSYLLPKALMPVANLPLIAYEIIPLVRAGVRQIIFAMGYKADLVRERLGDGSDWGAEFVYVEEATPLDTAGAIGNVRDLITGPFFACNGDMIYDVDLRAFAAEHLQRDALLSFCLRTTPDIRHFGLIQWLENGRVTAFMEKVNRDETGRNTVNSGFYLMSPQVFEYIPPGRRYSNERDLFPSLVQRGLPVYAHLPNNEGYWADVGRLDTYLQANCDIARRKVEWVHPAARSVVPTSTEIAGSVDVAENVVIGGRSIVGMGTAIGAGAVIGDGAMIAESVIWPGSRIGANARVHGSVVAGGTVPAGAGVINEVIVP